MNTYAVLLKKQDEGISAKIAEAYKKPAHYQINDTTYLVRTDRVAGDVVEDITEQEKKDDSLIVVLKLNRAHAGFYFSDFWDWLTPSEDIK